MKAIGRPMTTYHGPGGELCTIVQWHDNGLAEELEKLAGDLEIDIRELGKDRSQQQNRMLWEIIGRICKDPNAYSREPWDMYCYLLQMAGAKVTYVKVLADAVDDLKKTKHMRAMQVLSYETNAKGITWANCRLFLGSSTMNTKEMGQLIDTVIEYAEGMGVPTGDLLC